MNKGKTMEQEDFLKDLQPNNDVFEQPLDSQEPEMVTEDSTIEKEPANRETRRLRAKLQAERESSIALAARLEALTEARNLQQSPEADYLKSVERIYGTDSPEASAATELLKKALADVEKTATERALELFRQEQVRETEEVLQEERVLDSMIEELEDEYGVVMDEDTQRGFFTLLEKLSPKDRNGNVIEYADHHAVWDEYQVRKERLSNNSRAKELASRSVSRSASSPSTSVQADSNERWLRENGII